MTFVFGILLGLALAVGVQTFYAIFLFPKRDGGPMFGRLSREGKKGAIYAASYAYLVKNCPFMTRNQLHAGAAKMTDQRVSQMRKAGYSV